MKPRLLDTFDRRLRLEGKLITRTGLHIGAGRAGDPLATDAPVVRDAAGRPFIPGASLKGVLRSAAEALLRGIEAKQVKGEHLRSCDVLSGDRHGCIPKDDLKKLQDTHKEDYRALAETVWDRSCWVCRLFGSLAMAGRVRFPDLPMAGKELPPLELRNGVGIDRDKQLAAQGVLYDFEAVPPGTEFQLTVLLDNYTDEEAGFLLYLFEQLGEGFLSLGGKTSRGLGQVRVEWQTIRETSLRQDCSTENPFLDLLSTKDLLGKKDVSADEESTPAQDTRRDEGPALPVTGNLQEWRKLTELLRRLGEFDKSTLGQEASRIGLPKGSLNDKLGLGLEGKKVRSVWDKVQELLVECGFLVEREGRFYVAGQEPAVATAPGPQTATQAADTTAGRDPALQAIYDRYVGAMARLWQEAVA